MGEGRLHRLALERTHSALSVGALVPLSTCPVEQESWKPFQVRRLLSRTPKHLGAVAPKPNPFLPWDPQLEVERLGESHLLLLNKYPVQQGHVLLITQQWKPQSGWLERLDWQALTHVESDTPGLWFFNSSAAAGASQPHRHLQLLPREAGEASCPLAQHFLSQLQWPEQGWPWRYVVSRREATGTPEAAAELQALYHDHCGALGLGHPAHHPVPMGSYNLLLDQNWLVSVLRCREHWAGFSVNALGFAGYLLITAESDQTWLERSGPIELLSKVAVPVS